MSCAGGYDSPSLTSGGVVLEDFEDFGEVEERVAF